MFAWLISSKGRRGLCDQKSDFFPSGSLIRQSLQTSAEQDRAHPLIESGEWRSRRVLESERLGLSNAILQDLL